MSIATLILGESGTGKSASLRHLDPSKVSVYQCAKKPLPFKSKDWKGSVFSYDDIKIVKVPKLDKNNKPTNEIIEQILTPEQAITRFLLNSKKDILIIDDFQYLMSFEFMDTIGMDKSKGASFDRFNNIGNNAFRILRLASQLPEHKRVYILNHVETDDFGKIRFKTIGKLLDKMIVPEGLFSLSMRTQVDKDGYHFRTKNNGEDTVKTPMGMFEYELIDNDLKFVDDMICDYYGIETTKTTQPQENNQ